MQIQHTRVKLLEIMPGEDLMELRPYEIMVCIKDVNILRTIAKIRSVKASVGCINSVWQELISSEDAWDKELAHFWLEQIDYNTKWLYVPWQTEHGQWNLTIPDTWCLARGFPSQEKAYLGGITYYPEIAEVMLKHLYKGWPTKRLDAMKTALRLSGEEWFAREMMFAVAPVHWSYLEDGLGHCVETPEFACEVVEVLMSLAPPNHVPYEFYQVVIEKAIVFNNTNILQCPGVFDDAIWHKVCRRLVYDDRLWKLMENVTTTILAPNAVIDIILQAVAKYLPSGDLPSDRPQYERAVRLIERRSFPATMRSWLLVLGLFGEMSKKEKEDTT